ncbi:inositol monophosphatase family protein [Leuconostocaceae bacterium ESL0958]|nr:inositol monophosphatase family protein [Leuconostocaceae bacterium ESL0958]
MQPSSKQDYLQALDQQVSAYLHQLGATSRQQALAGHFQVAEKAGDVRNLVTNIDRTNQADLLAFLKGLTPAAHFVCEEGDLQRPETMAGPVWFVDPIDGTMNFVHEQTDFAIMVAYYEDGQPQLGWILQVMADTLIHGGPSLGIAQNDQTLQPIADRPLEETVMLVSGRRLLAQEWPYPKLAATALAYRVLGSAGISFSRLALGQAQGYFSKLSPWDLAAGRVLCESLGYQVKNLDGSQPDMLSSNTVLIATNKVQAAVHQFDKD